MLKNPHQMAIWGRWLLLFLLTTGGLLPGHSAWAQSSWRVQSGDGLALHFSNQGGLQKLAVGQKSLPLVSPDIIRVRVTDSATTAAQTQANVHDFRSAIDEALPEIKADSAGELIHSPWKTPPGKLSRKGNTLHIAGALPTEKLAVDTNWRQEKGYILLDGTIRDLSGRERCLDLKVQLPIDTRGWKWGNFPEDETIREAIAGARRGGSAIYPFASVSNSNGVGLSLAVPPTHPTRIETAADGSGVSLTFRIGLSPHSKEPGQTGFRSILFRHDAQWGLRSALERYYTFYREPFYARRVTKIGAWTTLNASRLINPQLYAYHEAGSQTWRYAGDEQTQHEADELYAAIRPNVRRGEPVGSTAADYERLSELALDEEKGILSLPYIIVGQRQIFQLPQAPQNAAQARNVLDTWTSQQAIPFEGPPQALSYKSDIQLKEIIRNSGIYTPGQELVPIIRQYQGHAVTFPQNPSPHLFAGQGKRTMAGYALDEYLPHLLRNSKYIDGVYVDSLGRWCGFYNYRQEHFRDAQVPLTYAGNPPRVALWNLQSHAEFLWELSRRMHGQSKIVFGNGVHPDRVLLGAALDVLGMEGSPLYDAPLNFYPRRVAAGSKPYCVLNAHGKSEPKLWHSALYQGLLLGCNTPEGAVEERRYLPTIIRLNQAGWEPVTQARATPATVGIERWGKEAGTLFFTVMNRSKTPVDAVIELDRSILKLPQVIGIRELISKRSIKVNDNGKTITVTIPLAAEQAVALEITSLAQE